MKASVEQGSPRMLIGYHNSHEQFSPRRLLNLAQQAEQAGFQGLFSSDHFLPWGTQQGESGFSFAWLGAAMQATRLPARVICCPFGRYHPTVVAQAAATLAEMFEDRFALALGSGQALNEHVTGERWPIKSVRMQRLHESVDVIRRLWAGETVTHHGSIVVEEAKLYSRPAKAPPLIGAAVTKESAASMGSWFDGLVTTSREPAEARELVQAFRAGGGQGKRLLLKVG